MELKDTYNRIAGDWFKDHKEDAWWHNGADRFLALLPPHASILDVGCGAGIKSKYFVSRGFHVTGIDFSDKLIDIATREVPEANFDVFDLYDLAKYPKTFDAVFALAVLLHVPREKIPGVLKDIKNKINPGGFLYIGTKEVWPDGKEEEVLKENDYGYDYERLFTYFSMSEMKKYAEEAEFSLRWENKTKVGKTTWIELIVQK